MTTLTPETPAEALSSDDDFDAAFASALTADSQPEGAPETKEPAETIPVGEMAPATPATPATPSDTPAVATTETAPPPVAATPTPAAIVAPVAAAIPVPPAAPEAAPVAETSLYDRLSEEQKTLLKSYQEEYPEIYQAEELRQQLAMQTALTAFSKELAEVLAPLVAGSHTSAEERHVNALAVAHPDYKELTPGIVEWVNKQPPFAKTAYSQILQEGSTQDVIDLLAMYKGTRAPAPATAAASPAAPAAVSAQAAALAPVTTKRSAPAVPAADANDFDAAFEEAAKSFAA